MSIYYVLIDKTPVPVETHSSEYGLDSDALRTWSHWMEYGNGAEADHKQVARTSFPGVNISTVFLGIDHSFSGKGPPILFETMVFPAWGMVSRAFYEKWNDYQDRYATWEEAEADHYRVRDMVQRDLLSQTIWGRVKLWWCDLLRWAEKPV